MSDKPFGAYTPNWRAKTVLRLSQYTPLGRGWARALMAKWLCQLQSGPVDVRLFDQNVRLYLGENENSCEIKALLKPHRYAKEEFAFCRQFMPQTGGVFVDIGANAGIFSLYLLSQMNSGTLLAAEPQAHLFQRLRDSLTRSNRAKSTPLTLDLLPVAIGDRDGFMDLSRPTQPGQASFRIDPPINPQNVAVKPLQQVLKAACVTHIDVLKLDIEGYEDAVLGHFFEMAPKALYPKAIVIEHCHQDKWRQDCLALLQAQGYVITGQTRTNTMLVYP